MKLSAKLEKAFNDQITLEFEASLVYRQLAIEVELLDLPGMAAWLRHQADEEIAHANKFIDHLLDRDNRPVIGDVPAFKSTAKTVLECFQAALEHEQRVSEAIRGLYRQTEQAGDLDSRPLLNWFLSEQLEEESTVNEIVGRIDLTNGDGPGLLRLDAELAGRPLRTTENA
ncbi:MAG: ferritin [Segniliparus sp.]|uniref:ferritin n=1 Tax=Segniliparus sp. TaxID=2804064 RepID=UPI003F2F02E1